MSMTIKEILNIAENRLRQAGIENANIDAEILFCHMMHFDRSQLFINWGKQIDDKGAEEFFSLVDTRVEGKPLQYITGRQFFMDISVKVDERVLIPRQDTEVLVEEVEKYIRDNRMEKASLLDLCTGSGIIAISLAKKYPKLKVTATDVNDDALSLARENIKAIGLEKNIKTVKSDLFEDLKKRKFNIIVSNPPYIPTSILSSLQREIYDYEPLIALDGGDDGLDFYRRIITQAPVHLKKKGAVFLEIGYNQAADLEKLVTESGAYSSHEYKKDLAENDRVFIAKV